MFEKLSKSAGNVLGYKVVGTITKEDYAALDEEVDELLQQEGNIHLLLDLEAFKSEELSAWRSDLMFGHDYHKKIDKLALVGDKKWQEWLAKIADPFYAREAKFFPVEGREAAWEWLRS